MARNKRRKLLQKPHNTPSSKNGPSTKYAIRPTPQRKKAQRPNPNTLKTPLPFDPSDKILLIGEGDFSFSRSLTEYHNCVDLTATSLDSADALFAKYPQARHNTEFLAGEAGQTVLYGIDATRLAGCKALRRGGFGGIVFNFPHVGGKSRDVNRQVRYNQELLVSFFKSALPLLKNPDGTIIVTVFEGEPYTLWNIKDLARHVGLRVGRSFKFQSEVYPGYRHARTLGNIEGGGGWKGESRSARTYIFEVNDGEGAQQNKPGKRKRKGEESDSEDEE
ncbi:MAG: hypothetical protein M1839_005096 [Geoglossum umbratile]|nr:MAG: hypothetical protein M1839_005096 [Geoglossum umbratile]